MGHIRGRNNGRSSVFADQINVLTEQLLKKWKKKTDHFALKILTRENFMKLHLLFSSSQVSQCEQWKVSSRNHNFRSYTSVIFFFSSFAMRTMKSFVYVINNFRMYINTIYIRRILFYFFFYFYLSDLSAECFIRKTLHRLV